MDDKRAYMDIADRMMVYGDDPEFESNVWTCVLKLPNDVQEFAIDHCRVFSVGRATLGVTWPARVATETIREHGSEPYESTDNIWILVISEHFEEEAFSNYQGSKNENIQSVIAHEIAHAWLKHDRMGETSPQVETEAADLTKRWGFVGRGTYPGIL